MSAVKDPDQVAALVRCFLDTEVAKKQKKLAEPFEKIAEANLPWSKPRTSDLSDTKEERLEHASKIQAKIAKNKAFATKKGRLRLTAVHVATILVLPIDDLRKGGWLSHEDFPNTLLHIRLQLMSNLVKRYLTKAQEDLTIADQSPEIDLLPTNLPHNPSNDHAPKRSYAQERDPAVQHLPILKKKPAKAKQGLRQATKASKPIKANKDPDYKPKPHVRSEAEKNKCRFRELLRCLFQHIGSGQVCHVLPFTWNNTEQAVQDTRAVHDAFVPFAAMSGAAGCPELLPDHGDWNKVKTIWLLYASLD